MTSRISGINMVQKKQRFILIWPGSDPLGGDCPIFYLEVTGNTALVISKASVGIEQV